MLEVARVLDTRLREVAEAIRGDVEPEPVFKVYVVTRADRKHYCLRWNDPDTGRERQRTTRTENHKEATRQAEELQRELNRAFFESQKVETRKRTVNTRQRFRIFSRDEFRCCLCGQGPKTDGVRLEVDHKIPHSKGGTDDDDNLQTTCFACNRGKGDSVG